MQPTTQVHAYPFHAVGGGELAEHGHIVQDGGVGGIGELAVVGGCTEVKLARGLRERVELHASGRRARCRGGGSGRHRGGGH